MKAQAEKCGLHHRDICQRVFKFAQGANRNEESNEESDEGEESEEEENEEKEKSPGQFVKMKAQGYINKLTKSVTTMMSHTAELQGKTDAVSLLQSTKERLVSPNGGPVLRRNTCAKRYETIVWHCMTIGLFELLGLLGCVLYCLDCLDCLLARII